LAAAVRTPTASGTAPTGSPLQSQSPIRTCIGCRQRAAAAELLRVVVTPDAIGTAGLGPSEGDELSPRAAAARAVVPDPRQRRPGRGAWLHRDLDCVELAERRRAFARALRVPGPLDSTPVRDYLATVTR
jgi:predicted RNA-binding protein YlxR (DUF448 family)